MKPIITIIFFVLITQALLSQNPESQILIDIDGNSYKTILIGNQEWMAENLRTTTYNNGIEIPMVVEKTSWISLHNGAFCWYNNDKINGSKYGALYNWYAVNTGNLCPLGWRVPTDKDWIYLEAFADSQFENTDTVWYNLRTRGVDAGVNLKAKHGWNDDGNGSDSFGFNALPGGERISSGKFLAQGINGFFWSSTLFDSTKVWYRCINYGFSGVFRGIHPKFMGFSVRCIRDN